MRTYFMTRFRPADDTAWAGPDTNPRLRFGLVTDLRGARGYDSSEGQRLTEELEIRFTAEPAPPDPDCADLVDRVGWGIAPTTFPHFAFDAEAVRVSAPVLAAAYTPPAQGSPAAIDVKGQQMVVQFPDGNLVAWLVPQWGLYAVAVRYAPPLEVAERPLRCRPVGPHVSMDVPARLVIVVAGNGEVVAEAVGDGKTDAFPVEGSAPDPEPTHSGMTWAGALTFDGGAIELDFFGAIDEQWTLTVVNSPQFEKVLRVSGDHVGTVGDYPLGATINPVNEEAGAPYFTMSAEGWPEGGDPPQVGDVLIFTTSAAKFLPPDLTCDASLVLDQAALTRWIAERSGPALSDLQDYPVYLETARGWGELAWRAVHDCPRAESEWLPGRAVIDNDRGSDGAVWVYGRERAQVGVLRLRLREWVLLISLRWPNFSFRNFNEFFVKLNGHDVGHLGMGYVGPGRGEWWVHFVPEGFPLETSQFYRYLTGDPVRMPGPVFRYSPAFLRADGQNVIEWQIAGGSFSPSDYLLRVRAYDALGQWGGRSDWGWAGNHPIPNNGLVGGVWLPAEGSLVAKLPPPTPFDPNDPFWDTFGL